MTDPSLSQDRSVAVVIVAAGRGQRFGEALPKQYSTLGGMTVLERSIQCFLEHPRVTHVQPVIAEADQHLFQDLSLKSDKLLDAVPGGANRQASVRAGLYALADHNPDLVLIHDGARPLIRVDTIDRVISALYEDDAVVAGIPASDTLRKVDDAGHSCGMIDRGEIWRAQTPQGFTFEKILAAHRAAPHENFTDDAALAEYMAIPVKLVEDHISNIKITHPDDLAIAEALLSEGMQADVTAEVRTGFGYDVHRFETGDHVMLCGLSVPHTSGLAGHSDADVALHALVDALLGAAGLEDIGAHFPPSDERWCGASSSLFVEEARRLITEAGGQISNVDVTIICEAPKVGPYRGEMRQRVADLLAIDISRVNIKATTTEGLGFTGRSEGIAAQAVATLQYHRKN